MLLDTQEHTNTVLHFFDLAVYLGDHAILYFFSPDNLLR